MSNSSTRVTIAALEAKLQKLEGNAERVKAQLDRQKEKEQGNPSQNYEDRMRQYQKLVTKGEHLKAEVARIRARMDASDAKAEEKAEPKETQVAGAPDKVPAAPAAEEPRADRPAHPAQPKAPSGLNRKERRRLARLEKQKAWAKAHPEAGQTPAEKEPEPVSAPKPDSPEAPAEPVETPAEKSESEEIPAESSSSSAEDAVPDLPDELDPGLDGLDDFPDDPDLKTEAPKPEGKPAEETPDDPFRMDDTELFGFDGIDDDPEWKAEDISASEKDSPDRSPDSSDNSVPDNPDTHAGSDSDEADDGLSSEDRQFLDSLPRTMGVRPADGSGPAQKAGPYGQHKASRPDAQPDQPAEKDGGHPSKKADARVPEQTSRAEKRPQAEQPGPTESARKKPRPKGQTNRKPAVRKRHGIRVLPPAGGTEDTPLLRQRVATESGLWTSVRKPKRG